MLSVALLVVIISFSLLLIFTLFDKTRLDAFFGIGLLILLFTISIISFLIFYKPEGTPYRPTDRKLVYINFHNIGNLESVDITFPWGEKLKLNNGSSLFEMGIYETEKIKAVGEFMGEKYNEDFTYSDLTVRDVYFSTGGAKPESQYIVNFVIDNTKNDDSFTLYATDSYRKWYERVKVPEKSRKTISVWIGQSLSPESSGKNFVVVESTDRILEVVKGEIYIK